MTFWWEQYRHCPRCGGEYAAGDLYAPTTSLRCRGCGYEFFQNSSPACTAVVPSQTRPREIALLTRTTPPGDGLLGLPGGFLQYHESPFDAVRREVWEELHVRVDVDRLFDAYTVDYRFRGSLVSVVELVFLCRPIDIDVASIRTDEAACVAYFDAAEFLDSHAQLAFPEQQQALRRYYEHLDVMRHAVYD